MIKIAITDLKEIMNHAINNLDVMKSIEGRISPDDRKILDLAERIRWSYEEIKIDYYR